LGTLASVLAGAYNVSPVQNQYLGATTHLDGNAYSRPDQFLQGMID
jgi:hypothetical protein